MIELLPYQQAMLDLYLNHPSTIFLTPRLPGRNTLRKRYMSIMFEEKYPTLRFCAAEIAYDNGMINRWCSEEKALQEMYTRVWSKYSVEDLDKVEAQLVTVPREQLVLHCTAEWASQMQKLSPEAEAVLNTMFGE